MLDIIFKIFFADNSITYVLKRVLFSELHLKVKKKEKNNLQLSSSMLQSCRSMGKYWRFIWQDAVTVNLEKIENFYWVLSNQIKLI